MKTPAMQIFHYTLKQMEAVHDVSQALAKHFPRPQQYVLAIHELLINAIEHGNLDIGFEQKTQLLQNGTFREEIVRRQAMPEYAGRNVHICIELSMKACSLTIRDEGRGFKPQDYLGRLPDVTLPNGRGLHIAECAAFDEMQFNGTGNMVRCVVRGGAGAG